MAATIIPTTIIPTTIIPTTIIPTTMITDLADVKREESKTGEKPIEIKNKVEVKTEEKYTNPSPSSVNPNSGPPEKIYAKGYKITDMNGFGLGKKFKYISGETFIYCSDVEPRSSGLHFGLTVDICLNNSDHFKDECKLRVFAVSALSEPVESLRVPGLFATRVLKIERELFNEDLDKSFHYRFRSRSDVKEDETKQDINNISNFADDVDFEIKEEKTVKTIKAKQWITDANFQLKRTGYKVTDADGFGRDRTYNYRVGVTYIYDKNINATTSGLHFYPNAPSCLKNVNHLDRSRPLRFFAVSILGEFSWYGDIFATDVLKIDREIPFDEMKKLMSGYFKVGDDLYLYNEGKLDNPDEPSIVEPKNLGSGKMGYTKKFYLNDKLSRNNDLPAVMHADGSLEYLVDGELHREGEPAKILANGVQEFWYRGKRHRSNGLPAWIHPNGSVEFWDDGKLHNDNGPSSIDMESGIIKFHRRGVYHQDGDFPCYIATKPGKPSDYKYMYKVNGEFHKIGGPASETFRGDKDYYRYGEHIKTVYADERKKSKYNSSRGYRPNNISSIACAGAGIVLGTILGAAIGFRILKK